MAGRAIATGTVDLFQDEASVEQSQSRSPVAFWNQGCQPARFSHGSHEVLGVSRFLFALTPVILAEPCTQGFHPALYFLLCIGLVNVHIDPEIGRANVCTHVSNAHL